MKTLIINTYAGSLLLGANALRGANIIGSFEDCGFGVQNTKANRAMFTEATDDFQFVDHIKLWPDMDLTDTVVLAHPPCAAFSQQNTSKLKRGVNTDAFECTRKVLKYAMNNGAAAIAVESVMGALAGAWDVHEHMAAAGGYHIYRVLKNSILFGVPQFRERFWCVFVRKDLGDSMTWTLSPKFRNVSSVLDPLEVNTPIGTKKTVDRFIAQLVTGPCRCKDDQGQPVYHNFDEADLRATGLASIDGWLRKGFSTLIQPKFFPNLDKGDVCRKHVSPFSSGQPSVLAPGGWAPVLLGSSLWVYKGETVSKEGYCAIMGFPPAYEFPKDTHYGVRTFLSKGVCPPVATWVLANIRANLGAPLECEFTQEGGYVKRVEPGHIISFRPGRQTLIDKYRAMWLMSAVEDDETVALRNEEEALEED